MENHNFCSNNLKPKSQQQSSSRADKAASWRSARESVSDGPNKKRKNLLNERPSDTELVYNNAVQRDTRVASWCNDVQRHKLGSHFDSGFTVFTDSPSNQPMAPQQRVGVNLNARESFGPLLSPFQQSMNMPNLLSMSTSNLTSANLRTPEMTSQRFPEPSFGFNQTPGFNQEIPRVTREPQVAPLLTRPFSPWPESANVLQLRDPNQKNMFNSSAMVFKHEEVPVKLKNTIEKSTQAPQNKNPRTWSQVASGQAFGNRTSIDHAEEVKPVFPQCSATTTALVKEDMDMDLEDDMSLSSSPRTTFISPPIRESRYITDSLAFISSGVNNDQNISVIRPYTVLKIKNISWNVSASDVYDALTRYKLLKLPDIRKLPQCVHIFMDVKTGKTLNTAYVELEVNATTSGQIDQIIRNINIPQAQGRHITVSRSSYDELCNDLFSGWRGQFSNGMACPHTDSRDSSSTQRSQYYIGQKDLQRLLNVCRFFKTYYNRKCAERPFEYLITIIMNMPWKQPHAVTTAQRDIIYECYKLATEALYKHVNRPYHSFDDELLPRMVRAAIICDGFTVRQKKVVLGNAKATCPRDLETYMQEPTISTSGFTAFLR